MINKIKDKQGGLKELLYDNIGIFIVLVLIVVVGFSIANKTVLLGNSVKTEQDTLKTLIDSTIP